MKPPSLSGTAARLRAPLLCWPLRRLPCAGPGLLLSPPLLRPARFYRARARARSMADYGRWTKEALVQRVQALEQALAQRPGHGAAGGPEASRPEASRPDAGASAPPPKTQKTPRPHATRYIALKLAYLGARYGGFEYQPSGALPTVEEELWKALVKACLVTPRGGRAGAHEVDFSVCDYSKCGRTDRGVSAFGQVVALRVRSRRVVAADGGRGGVADGEETAEGAGRPAAEADDLLPAEEADLPPADEIQYAKVLNRLLPPDIRVLAWCPTPPPGFSARFSCRERRYRYFFTQPAFWGADDADAETEDGLLDIEAMRAAARHFVGAHDFRNFCKVDPSKQITNFVRRIFAADIVEVPDLQSPLQCFAARPPAARPRVYALDVRGSAFLWHQIRHMVAVLFLVGQRREPPSVVPALLDVAACPGRPPYAMAAETPLVLWDCVFPRLAEAGEEADPPDPVGPDHLAWHTVADEEPHSRTFVDGLWRGWHAAKMHEILANRLLDQVTAPRPGGAPPIAGPRRTSAGAAAARAAAKNTTTLLYEGGDLPRRGGAYVPLLQRPPMAPPAEVNDRFARQKGFASAAAMRAVGNWRAALKEREVEQ